MDAVKDTGLRQWLARRMQGSFSRVLPSDKLRVGGYVLEITRCWGLDNRIATQTAASQITARASLCLLWPGAVSPSGWNRSLCERGCWCQRLSVSLSCLSCCQPEFSHLPWLVSGQKNSSATYEDFG